MSDYRVDAATKEGWAERAFAAEGRLSLLEGEHRLMSLINECPDVTIAVSYTHLTLPTKRIV